MNQSMRLILKALTEIRLVKTRKCELTFLPSNYIKELIKAIYYIFSCQNVEHVKNIVKGCLSSVNMKNAVASHHVLHAVSKTKTRKKHV